jgi:hypothetical protein
MVVNLPVVVMRGLGYLGLYDCQQVFVNLNAFGSKRPTVVLDQRLHILIGNLRVGLDLVAPKAVDLGDPNETVNV